MATVLKHWKEAATLIIVTSSRVAKDVAVKLTKATANKPGSTVLSGECSADGLDNNLDVLMLKRSSKNVFMPNLHVFPGGASVDSDFSRQWFTVFDKLGVNVRKRIFEGLDAYTLKSTPPPIFTRDRGDKSSALPPEVAFRICAIRETFEESGVLIARPAKDLTSQLTNYSSDPWTNKALVSAAEIHEDQTVIDEWRQRVNKNPDDFLLMCLQLDLVPEIWSLHEWSNWLTPTMDKRRRFDTIFYVCCVDHKPEAVHDSAETVQVTWASPRSVLSAFYNQSGGLAPPQVYELARLLNFSSASDVLRFVSRPDRLRVERYLPIFGICKDALLSLYPGDDLYPSNPSPTESTILNFEETLEELNAKYPNQNRTVHGKNLKNPLEGIFYAACTIPPRPSHVNPRCDITDRLVREAKAKL